MTGNAQNTISALQLKELLNTDSPPILLDVREDAERQICSLPGSVHIPMGHLSTDWEQLPKDRVIVVYCHHGYRSGQATQFLKSLGFDSVLNLKGGIHAWAKHVDPTLPCY